MSKTVKRVWDWLSSIVVAAVVLLAIALVGVRLVGLNPYVVLSGSMEPVYSPGDLVYVKTVDPFTLQEGDIITFMVDENTVATHRMVGVVPDETDPDTIRFRTKGDANDTEDGTLVHYKNVIGKPVCSIPKLGYVASYIQQPPGMYVAISASALFLALMFIPDLLKEDEEETTETDT